MQTQPGSEPKVTQESAGPELILDESQIQSLINLLKLNLRELEVGGNNYSAEVNRDGRKITISIDTSNPLFVNAQGNATELIDEVYFWVAHAIYKTGWNKDKSGEGPNRYLRLIMQSCQYAGGYALYKGFEFEYQIGLKDKEADITERVYEA